MPVPIPPWLTGATPAQAASAWLQGAALGQRRAEAAQRAALEAQEQAQRAAERQAQTALAAQRVAAEIESQRMAAERALADLAFRQSVQRLREAQAEAGRQALRSISSEVAAGEDPRRSVLKHLEAFAGTPQAVPPLLRELRPPEELAPEAVRLEGLPPAVRLGGRLYWPPQVKEPAPPPAPSKVELEGLPPAIQLGGRLYWPPGAGARPGEQPFEPRAVEIKHPVTGKPMGVYVQTGAHSGSFLRERREEDMSWLERERVKMLMGELKKARDNERTLRQNFSLLPPGTPTWQRMSNAVQQATEEISKLERSINEIRLAPPQPMTPNEAVREAAAGEPDAEEEWETEEADEPEEAEEPEAAAPTAEAGPQPVMVRHRATGKIYIYRGNREDVPEEEYEILH